MTSTPSSSFINSYWRQILVSITQKNNVNNNSSNTSTNSNNYKIHSTDNAGPRFWLLTCCVLPQSEIARIRFDRSMISQPTDFRHIGHMGADDLSSSYNEHALNSLLQSKGSDKFGIPVPKSFRANDVPIIH